MRAIIIDDELKSRQVLSTLLSQFFDGIEIIGGAGDISGSLKIITELKPDIVFLDISLQDGDSFAILNQLKEINFKIIFITAFDEYATQAIQFTHIPCLHKPIDIDELGQAIVKVNGTSLATVQEDTTVILNVLNSQFSIIPMMDIFKITFITDNELLYIKKDGNECLFLTNKHEKLKSWYPFNKYIHLLKGHSFAQPNEEYLVFLEALEKFPQQNDTSFNLVSHNKNISIPISLSEDYKADFIKRYSKQNQNKS